MVRLNVRDAAGCRVVPPGRLTCDLDSEHLLLHTVQTSSAFGTLQDTGRLVPDPNLAEPLFTDAYEWMYSQMAARLPTQGDGAVWLWARIRRRDLVDQCRQSPGSVLLTCRIPRAEVLLSHFQDWHLVLNRAPGVARRPGETESDAFSRWEREDEELHARLAAAGLVGSALREWPSEDRDRVERSWASIFDRERYGRYECWQATMHALRIEDVVDAVRIPN